MVHQHGSSHEKILLLCGPNMISHTTRARIPPLNEWILVNPDDMSHGWITIAITITKLHIKATTLKIRVPDWVIDDSASPTRVELIPSEKPWNVSIGFGPRGWHEFRQRRGNNEYNSQTRKKVSCKKVLWFTNIYNKLFLLSCVGGKPGCSSSTCTYQVWKLSYVAYFAL